MTRDQNELLQGSPYPAVQRMNLKGWIRSQWERSSRAVDRVLEWSGSPA